MFKWWGLVLFLGVQSFAWGVSLNPAIQWKVLKTPHFRIIFDSKDGELARQYAYYAEKSRAKLKPYFSEFPERVTILIDDSSDAANGFATFLPYRYISIFPVLPEDASSLENFQVWSELILLHEYAHILQFEPTNGFYRPLRYLFGRIVTPNALLPNWNMEGMAVDFESQLTEVGRLRSSTSNARFRAMAEDKTLDNETIDQLNESGIPRFPFGERPYHFGGVLMNSINKNRDDKTPDYLLQKSSRRIPFSINGPIIDRTQKDWTDLWNELRADINKKALAQTESIRSQSNGVEELQVLPKESKSMQTFVRISPNRNRLIYVDVNKRLTRRLYLVERTENGFDFASKKFLLKLQGTGRIDWSPDSQSLLLDMIAYNHRDQYFKDLYLFKIADKKLTRLTRGQRAGDASFSPDGKKAVYVATVGAATELKEIDIASGQFNLLAKSRLQERISWPVYESENSVLFSLRNVKGIQSIYKKVPGSDPQKYFSGLKNLSHLRMTPDGLIAVSDQNGTRNLYLISNSTAKVLTQTTTEVVGGEYDPQDKTVYYARLTGFGPRLYRSTPVMKDSLPQIEPLIEVAPPGPPIEFAAVDVKVENYSAWPYMWPTYWYPFIYPASEGVLIQGSTAIFDPLGKHNYSLQGSYDTFTESGSFAGVYAHRNRYRTLSATGAHTSSPVTLNSKETIDSDYVAGDVSFYLTQGFSLPMAIGYSYSDDNYANLLKYRRQGPSVAISYSTQVPRDPDGKDSEIGSGYMASLKADSFIKQDGFLDYDRLGFAFQTATSAWLPEDHNLTFALRGSFAPNLPFSLVRVVGDTTVGASYVANLISSNYLVRGYPSGTFRGRKIINANLEYELLFSESFYGFGTLPAFLKDTKLAIFLDGVAVDGAYSDTLGAFYRSEQFKDIFAGTGFEFRMNLTLGYKLPVTAIAGMHFPLSEKTDFEPSPFIGFGLGSLSELASKPQAKPKFGH